MSYSYTSENRLEHPHNYMYTPFKGPSLLLAYQNDRTKFIDRITKAKQWEAPDIAFETTAFVVLSTKFGAVQGLGNEQIIEVNAMTSQIKKDQPPTDLIAQSLNNFDIGQTLETLPLLHAIIASQLRQKNAAEVKKWLDLLVQRFEVTKRIYSRYQMGFRVGEGQFDNIRLYWLLALSLILHYAEMRQLKFLSSVIKLIDLLSSLPVDDLGVSFTNNTMCMIVRAEVGAVGELSAGKGIHFDS